MRSRTRDVPAPCPEFEAAFAAAAWGEEGDPAWADHLASCSACREALAATRDLADRVGSAARPPETATRGLAGAVMDRTTRAPRGARVARWGWVAGAAATAGAAFLALRRPAAPPQPGPAWADVDLDLLDDLDLAENLDLLEVLDALERLDDG